MDKYLLRVRNSNHDPDEQGQISDGRNRRVRFIQPNDTLPRHAGPPRGHRDSIPSNRDDLLRDWPHSDTVEIPCMVEDDFCDPFPLYHPSIARYFDEDDRPLISFGRKKVHATGGGGGGSGGGGGGDSVVGDDLDRDQSFVHHFHGHADHATMGQDGRLMDKRYAYSCKGHVKDYYHLFRPIPADQDGGPDDLDLPDEINRQILHVLAGRPYLVWLKSKKSSTSNIFPFNQQSIFFNNSDTLDFFIYFNDTFFNVEFCYNEKVVSWHLQYFFINFRFFSNTDCFEIDHKEEFPIDSRIQFTFFHDIDYSAQKLWHLGYPTECFFPICSIWKPCCSIISWLRSFQEDETFRTIFRLNLFQTSFTVFVFAWIFPICSIWKPCCSIISWLRSFQEDETFRTIFKLNLFQTSFTVFVFAWIFQICSIWKPCCSIISWLRSFQEDETFRTIFKLNLFQTSFTIFCLRMDFPNLFHLKARLLYLRVGFHFNVRFQF